MHYKAFWESLSKHKKYAILLGTRFDFDSLGSGLALNEVLKGLGKTVDLYYPDELPPIAFELIKRAKLDQIKIEQAYSQINFKKYDALVFCDTQQVGVLTSDLDFVMPDFIETYSIDHHNKNKLFAKHNLVREKISTCAIFYKLFTNLGIKIDAKIAHLLLLGHITDSGNLSYPGVRPVDFHIAGDLLALSGINIFEISNTLSKQDIFNLKFKGYILSRIQEANDYAYVEYSEEEVEKQLGIDSKNITVSAVDSFRPIKGRKFVYTINKKKDAAVDGKCRFSLSFRSCDINFDVSKIAGIFGGGGHKTAAGAMTFAKDYKEIHAAIAKIQLPRT